MGTFSIFQIKHFFNVHGKTWHSSHIYTPTPRISKPSTLFLSSRERPSVTSARSYITAREPWKISINFPMFSFLNSFQLFPGPSHPCSFSNLLFPLFHCHYLNRFTLLQIAYDSTSWQARHITLWPHSGYDMRKPTKKGLVLKKMVTVWRGNSSKSSGENLVIDGNLIT